MCNVSSGSRPASWFGLSIEKQNKEMFTHVCQFKDINNDAPGECFRSTNLQHCIIKAATCIKIPQRIYQQQCFDRDCIFFRNAAHISIQIQVKQGLMQNIISP